MRTDQQVINAMTNLAQLTNLFLLLILVQYSEFVNSQVSGNSSSISTSTTAAPKITSDTTTINSIVITTTSTPDTSTIITTTASTSVDPSTASEVLLSGDEFVDFTEAPTILYDGNSNERNDTASSSNSSLKEDNSTTTSANPSLQTPPSVVANKTTDNILPDTGTFTTTVEPLKVTTNEIGSEEAEGETEGDVDEDAQDGTKETKPPFNPPQNVSQYMDYIEHLFHDLRHQITDLFEPHIPQLIRTSQMVQLTGSCSFDMLRMALALRQFEPWALRMIDSSGKVPEGIFEGSFTALGSYDECLSTVFVSSASDKQNSNQQQGLGSPTQGKYCLVNVSPFLPPKPPADRVEHMFQEEANRRNYTKDDQFSRLSPMFYYMKFRIGVCIPSTCVESDLESISNALSSSLRLNITIPHCRVAQNQPITSQQLVGGLVFGFVMATVLVATLMDYSERKFARVKRKKLAVLGILPDSEVTLEKPTAQTISATLKTSTAIRVDGSCRGCQEGESSSAKSNFSKRLEEHWSWMSFSLFANHKLYFKNTKHEYGSPCCRSNISCQQELDGREKRVVKSTDSSMIIRCLDGIRVLSLCWVIIANSYITLDPRATKRLTKTREAPKDFLFQMVAQASLAIETFFFLSGVLMSLSFARKLNPAVNLSERAKLADDGSRNQSYHQATKHSKKSSSSYAIRWLHFYVHRYMRMTPATMLVIAFTMFAFRYGDGPLWFEATHKAHQSCSQNWWRHLLHVANYIDTRQMCFIHYWYIAADMQLFLFAPILMFLLYQQRHIGYTIATLIGALSIGSVFYTTYIQNLPPTLLFYNSDPESRREFGNTIMTKPLTHVLPYMVGMLVGKWLITHKACSSIEPDRVKSAALKEGTNKPLAILFGFVATLVALAEVFLPYKWNNSHLPTRFLASLYAALFRFCWSLVLAYLVISCRHKRGKRCRSAERLDAVRFASNESRYHCECWHNQKHQQQHHKADKWSSLSQGELQWRQLESCVQMNHNEKDEEQWCHCGSGGSVLNRLLSLNMFTHLSKLSFVAYLIHLPLMSVFIAQTRGLFAFSHTLVIHLALSYLVMTFILSFLLVHIIEFPFITFERYLFERLFYKSNSNDGGISESVIKPIQTQLRKDYKPDKSQRSNQHEKMSMAGTIATAPVAGPTAAAHKPVSASAHQVSDYYLKTISERL